MKLTDFVGNDLVDGDIVTLKPDHVVGQIIKVETGNIVKGLSLEGRPSGQEQPPHILIQIQMTSAMIAGADGKIAGVIKVAKPPQNG